MKILSNLDSYGRESRFTTWAQKIALHLAFTELRRRKWRDVSLEELLARREATGTTSDPLTDTSSTPEEAASQEMMLATVRRLISEELTERQRTALVAVMLGGMLPEEAARRMNTNRNALYKLIHDARRKLRKSLIAEGFHQRDLLETFDKR